MLLLSGFYSMLPIYTEPRMFRITLALRLFAPDIISDACAGVRENICSEPTCQRGRNQPQTQTLKLAQHEENGAEPDRQ